ncbi:hypothetical protein M885DRAFT_556556 [Pelagophyceae sp. CCMP2097]|nr:hypothetical protein M885DRAFT_556556 [Pelagophyceae sp. CCMP2097]
MPRAWLCALCLGGARCAAAAADLRSAQFDFGVASSKGLLDSWRVAGGVERRERYFSIVGGLLVSRLDARAKHQGLSSASEVNVAANVCAANVGGAVLFFSGEDNSHNPTMSPRRNFTGIGVQIPSRRGFHVVIRGDHPGCVDRRAGYGGRCQFDGKLSAAMLKGRLLLYARSNLVEGHGGRFVQAPFRPVEIDGLRLGGNVEATNVYFAAVKPNPVDDSTVLGLFPVSSPRSNFRVVLACVGTGVGRALATFVGLTCLVPSNPADGGRTADHPVDGFFRFNGTVSFYVHLDVEAISKALSRLLEVKASGHGADVSHESRGSSGPSR